MISLEQPFDKLISKSRALARMEKQPTRMVLLKILMAVDLALLWPNIQNIQVPIPPSSLHAATSMMFAMKHAGVPTLEKLMTSVMTHSRSVWMTIVTLQLQRDSFPWQIKFAKQMAGCSIRQWASLEDMPMNKVRKDIAPVDQLKDHNRTNNPIDLNWTQ